MATRSHNFRSRRGVAMLITMIALVVCTILTAGFLASQGTAMGIARNERDGEQARAAAFSGLSLVVNQIKNSSSWRTSMSQSLWLNNYAIGNGAATVYVYAADGSGSFQNDLTKPVIVVSTGTSNGRSYTTMARVGPTGMGTVYYDGHFLNGTVTIANGTGLTTPNATIDSYNSSTQTPVPLRPFVPGSLNTNGRLATNSNAVDGVSILNNGSFYGTVSLGSNASLAITASGSARSPDVITKQTSVRTLPSVVFPNTTGLTNRGSINRSSGSQIVSTTGYYSSITITGGTVFTLMDGTLHCTGNVSIGSLGHLYITGQVDLVVDGSVTINGRISLNTTSSRLRIFSKGTVTFNTANLPTWQTPSQFQLYGSSTCSTIDINGATNFVGTIFAPNANVTLKCSDSLLMTATSPQMWGGVIASTLTVKDSSVLHFDEALRTYYETNVQGGTAPPGTADYYVQHLGASRVKASTAVTSPGSLSIPIENTGPGNK